MKKTKVYDVVDADPEIHSPVPDNDSRANRNEPDVGYPEQTDKVNPCSDEDLQEPEELEEPYPPRPPVDNDSQEPEELEEPYDDEIGKSVEEADSCHGSRIQYPPRPLVDNDYSRALDVHRVIFNREVFGTDFEEGSPSYVHPQRSRTISSERIDLIIRYLRAKEDDPILCEEMKMENGTNVYDWVNHYQLDYRKNEEKYVLLRTPHLRQSQAKRPIQREKVVAIPSDMCTLVIRPEEIFDAIDACHREVVHKRRTPTYHQCQKYYYNITQDMVAKFISLCPVCNAKPVRNKKKVSGAVHPLKSHQFRIRYQADLIDFNSNPQKDIDGIVRRWVLVIKDHFTKLAWCRPLRRKTAKLVKHELVKLMNEVGWPLIFHTDNGSEFCAKVITEIIKDHPFICSVTGRTRVPSDQGSVERLNQEIKRLIDSIIKEH